METKTREIIDRFEQINAIPRCSKNEQAICRWLQQWAKHNGFSVRSDTAGNMVISVPAAGGMDGGPMVVIQGHVDMVCEKRAGSGHDFDADPVRHVVEGDWLRAEDTSLGADNGIAIAIGMVLAESRDVPHPPLELLFTVDEETGLTGVKELPDDLLTGSLMLNLDSEEEGVFTVGCAGGRDATLTLAVERTPADGPWNGLALTAGGMQGGHSGIDIIKQRANANKVLVRCLDQLRRRIPLRLVDLAGGTVHNAIPREATARFLHPVGEAERIAQLVAGFEKEIRSEFGTIEPTLSITLTDAASDPALTETATGRAIDFLAALPSGVANMAADLDKLVETSSNLAVMRLGNDALTVRSSQRSSVASRLEEICSRVSAVARLAGAELHWRNAYPPWTPDLEAPLLQRCRQVYADLFGRQPEVRVLHAGLECAVIGALYPEMAMISFGPTIENPHSPDERLHLPSVERVWRFLTALMGDFHSR